MTFRYTWAMRIFVALLMLAFMLGGCRASAPGPLRPPGFTIGTLVLAPTSPVPGPGTPRETRGARPARYLVESDLSLRVATGPMVASPTAGYPPIVRTLTPAQMDRLWLLVRDAGLLSPDHPGRRDDYRAPPPDARHAIAVFEVSSDFQPFVVTVPLDGSSSESIAALELLDHLAALAWIAP